MKLALLALLLPSIAAARLGEAPEQCVKRYGSVDESHSGERWQTITYTQGGVGTTCWFWEGKCVCISFRLIDGSKVSLSKFGEDPRFTQEQEQQLLAANGGGTKWKVVGDDRNFPSFETEDGKIRALGSSGMLMIQLVSDIERRVTLLTPEAISKAIEGF